MVKPAKLNQDGLSGAVVSLVLTVVLLIGAISFGYWAYSSRQDYKNNVDAKIKAAQAVTKQQEDAIKAKEYAEEAKKPLQIYKGPEAYGSLSIAFPKTWSAYVDDTGTGSALVDGYFAPGTVPSATAQDSIFALRVKVVNSPYNQVLQTFKGQQQTGKLTVSAYSLPKLPKTVGVKAVGQVSDQTNVTMVVLPLRSQTLQIWTEGNQYLADFNNYILPNFSFSP